MAKNIGETPTRRSYIKSYEDQKKEELISLIERFKVENES